MFVDTGFFSWGPFRRMCCKTLLVAAALAKLNPNLGTRGLDGFKSWGQTLGSDKQMTLAFYLAVATSGPLDVMQPVAAW